jgi:Uma2 family endonuclease
MLAGAINVRDLHMVDASVQTEKLTFEEYDRLYEEIGPIELINGEIISHRFQPYITLMIGHDLFRSRFLYLDDQKLGMAFVHYTYFLIDQDNMITGVRRAHVAFLSQGRLDTYRKEVKDYEDKPFMLVPDLAVEVHATNEHYTPSEHKIDTYLKDGVKLIWVIYPDSETVTVYEGGDSHTLNASDTLSGGDIIPGFEIPVSTLFEVE